MDTILESYDKSKIGKLISWGGDHTVYEYGEDKVIKFSLVERLMGKNGGQKVKNDFEICKKFFGKYILETQFTLSAEGKRPAAMQPKVIGRYLSKADLKDPTILEQFKEIMVAYSSLAASGNAKIDLIGRGGILKSCMSNIFVLPNKQLSIIDASLLECEGAGFFKPIFLFVMILASWRNSYTIRKFTT